VTSEWLLLLLAAVIVAAVLLGVRAWRRRRSTERRTRSEAAPDPGVCRTRSAVGSADLVRVFAELEVPPNLLAEFSGYQHVPREPLAGLADELRELQSSARRTLAPGRADEPLSNEELWVPYGPVVDDPDPVAPFEQRCFEPPPERLGAQDDAP
jgi:hypothetical protein